MEPSLFVLDSSAVLTFLDDEAGAGRVEEVIRLEDTLLPWPVLLEVYYVSQQREGAAEADRRFALLKQLPCEVLWEVDEAQVLTAARFKAKHRISLGDALVASYARSRGATLLHKDPEFDSLAGHVQLEALPYKKRF